MNEIALYCLFSVCKLNVHKRCQKNVANNCGINTRDLAQILQELGITSEKLSQKGRKKVSKSTAGQGKVKNYCRKAGQM